MAISVPLFQEYRDVLSRSESRRQLRLDEASVEVILQFVATVGRPTDISYSWRPNLKDEADNMVVELAVGSRSEYLITSNVRDFTEGADLKNDDLKIVTPKQFMQEWRRSHGK